MRQSFRLLAIGFLFLPFTAMSHASEKKISQSDLPAAVRKTAQNQSKGAIIKGYSQDKENGEVEYEVEMTVNGHSKDVSIGADGVVQEIEEQIELNKLPASVQSGLRDKAGKGTITKVESIIKHGVLVAYEAQVRTTGKHSEIQVGPEGKALSREE